MIETWNDVYIQVSMHNFAKSPTHFHLEKASMLSKMAKQVFGELEGDLFWQFVVRGNEGGHKGGQLQCCQIGDFFYSDYNHCFQKGKHDLCNP